jgi:hypothetical protein
MKRYVALALSFVFSITFANEVTYVEWDSGTGGAYLNLTVKVTKRKFSVECRVEHEGRAISSGMGLVNAGVAVVSIPMPSEFRNKQVQFKYFCE